MIQYLEYKDFSHIITYLSLHYRIDPYEVFQRKSWTSLLPVSKRELETDLDLGPIFESSDNLLFTSKTQQINWLIDSQDLLVESNSLKRVLEFIQQKENLTSDYFFYSSTNKKLNTEQKKLWQKHFSYQVLKLDLQLAQKMATRYNQTLNLNLSQSVLNQLVRSVDSYQEIFDKLDFLYLTGQPQKHLTDILPGSETYLHQFPLNKNSVNLWLESVSEDNLQLALAILWTKLAKDPKGKFWQKQLIELDQKIKTNAKINPLLWFKLFLWQYQNW